MACKKVFVEKWGLYQEQRQVVDASTVGKVVEASAVVEKPPASTVAGKRAAVAQSKSAMKKQKVDNESTPDDKQKQQQIVKKANSIKQKYQQCIPVYASMENAMQQNDQQYIWVGDFVKHRLKTARLELQSRLDNSAFGKFFMLNGIAEARKQFGQEYNSLLEKFAVEFDSVVDTLADEVARFKKMHLANS